jgi:hypothetical protein
MDGQQNLLYNLHPDGNIKHPDDPAKFKNCFLEKEKVPRPDAQGYRPDTRATDSSFYLN